ncbi:MAG: YdcF family protein [Bacteroidales bacterium]
MFFIFSKILSFLINPLTWIITLLLLALFMKNKKWSRRCLIYCVIVTLFFTNPFLANEATRLWEYQITQDKDLVANYDAGIVLGGGMVTIDTQFDRMTFRNNVDRIMQAVSLYKTGRIKRMLISSGSGSLVFRDMLEAALLKRYLITIGIPDSVMLIDSISDNTYQNAINSAQIIKKNFPNGKFLLITSSMHMRRAKACFEKAGINVTPYSTNKETGKRLLDYKQFIIPDIEALGKWNSLIHEIFGYLVYNVYGYL